jgi:hypothetical protein
MSKNDFFIGWAEDMPSVDRRFFLGTGLALTAGTAALAGILSAFRNSPNTGSWNIGNIREWRGIATAQPYSMMRTRDLDGTPRTVMLGCQGKCGVSARIGSHAGKSVLIRGSLIQRGKHAMIAVTDDINWIEEAPETDVSDLAFPAIKPLDDITLRGTILDSKCWFGAMSPARGKTHKSCASLCIRGGIPPAFFVKDRQDQKALLLMTDRGQAFGEDLLPFVADPVEISGKLQRWGDLLLIDSNAASLRRI